MYHKTPQGGMTSITTNLTKPSWTQHPNNSMSLNNLNDFIRYIEALEEAFVKDLERPRRMSPAEQGWYRRSKEVQFFQPSLTNLLPSIR